MSDSVLPTIVEDDPTTGVTVVENDPTSTAMSVHEEKKRRKRESRRARRKELSLKFMTCFSVFKMLFITVSTMVFVWLVGICFRRYVDAEKKSIITTVPVSEATVPAFTVCPAYETAYDPAELEAIGLKSADDYRHLGYFYGNTSDSWHDDGWFIFDSVALSCPDIVREVRISTADQETPTITVTPGQPSDAVEWFQKYQKLLGKCYSMSVMPNVIKKSVMAVEFYGRTNIYIYVHYPGQFMEPDSKSKVYVGVGEKLFADFDYKISEDSYGKKSYLPCDDDMNYFFDLCAGCKIREQMVNEFQCVVPWLPKRGCTVGDLVPPTVCRFNLSTAEGRARRDEVLGRYVVIRDQEASPELCGRPCAKLEVVFNLPVVSRDGAPGESFARLFLKTTTKMFAIERDYTWVTLLAEIGGYAGLLLGVSIIRFTGITKRVIRIFENG